MTAPLLEQRCGQLVTPKLVRGETWNARSTKNHILRNHCRMIGRMFRRTNRWTETLREPCEKLYSVIELRTELLTNVSHEQLKTIPILTRMASLQSKWIRDPFDWFPKPGEEPKETLRSLARHLFARYEVPLDMEAAFEIDGDLDAVERLWYCHVAQGGNLRTAPGIPKLTKRAVKCFWVLLGSGFSIAQTVRLAQIKAISVELPASILETSVGTDFANDHIWLPLLEATAGGNRPLKELHLIADFVESNRGSGCQFHFNVRRPWEELLGTAQRSFGVMVKAAIRRDEIDEDDADLMCPEVRAFLIEKQRLIWPKHPDIRGDHTETGNDRSGWVWEIKELNSQWELYEEGLDMSHCIASYGDCCRKGRIAVFSLMSRKKSELKMDRDVTIEVNLKSRSITEARAWANRYPHPDSGRAIKAWAGKNEISIPEWLKL